MTDEFEFKLPRATKPVTDASSVEMRPGDEPGDVSIAFYVRDGEPRARMRLSCPHDAIACRECLMVGLASACNVVAGVVGREMVKRAKGGAT